MQEIKLLCLAQRIEMNVRVLLDCLKCHPSLVSHSIFSIQKIFKLL